MNTTAAPQHHHQGPLSFDTHHEDVIHDAQFDYYGKRLATGSSDRTIRVFSVEPGQAEKLTATLAGHGAPVWQVAWAHPKFGSLLASCSYDGTVIIWKEQVQQQQPSHGQSFGGFHQQPTPHHHQQQQSSSNWIKIKEHRLHESSVNSISWAPQELGLILACASSDGQVSVLTYRLEDSSWDVKSFPAHQVGCNAVSWCPSPSAQYLASLATGAAPKQLTEKRLVTGGCDNLAKVWKWSEETSEWKLEASLEGHSDWVRDVSWCPPGIIATCSQDKSVLIWRESSNGSWSSQPLNKEPFGDTVWRLSWSTAGNLLAVSCGDNTVSLWRETSDHEWKPISKADQSTMASQ